MSERPEPILLEDLEESNLYRPTLMDQIKDLVNDTNSSFGDLFSPKRQQWISPYQKMQRQESSRKQMVIQRKGRNLKIYGVSKGSKNSRDSQHSQQLEHPPNSQQFGMMITSPSKLTLNEQARGQYSTFMVNAPS